MRTKQALLAVATALTLLGSASLALASDHEPTDSYGGIKIGPLGQVFGSNGRVDNGWNAYGLVAPSQGKHTTHKRNTRPASE